MAGVEVRDMTAEDETFVATCSHVHESAEIDASGQRRIAWLREREPAGLRVKVARLDGRHAGFAYILPIEISPWGPRGRDLAVMPCLWVVDRARDAGAGRALVRAAEGEARRQHRKALVTQAHAGDGWFMPAGFFEHCGFFVAARRGTAALLWKVFDPDAEPPAFLDRRYDFVPAAGRVVIDLFYNTFCLTSDLEARRVRDVAAEFGEQVLLREHPADDHEALRRHGIPRGIFVAGKEIGWGYEAPREGLREAIRAALAAGA